MILKGSQRGGAGQLARHLLRTDENDHVEVAQVRGFVSVDLPGALAEANAVSKGTRCKQFLFSLSLNPPKGAEATIDDLINAVDRAEERLGLKGHPRLVVIHEKEGRRHAHAVWSRIDANEMKAVNLPFFKTRLAALSKELYLEHGWELPDGHKENGWHSPLNFTLAEWQQAKRLGLDPREVKQVFQTAWKQSDNLASFKSALSDKGYYLAKGDRRGFVAVDIHGEVFAVARLAGLKTKEVEARLGTPDALPNVDAVKADLQARLKGSLRQALQESRRAQRREMTPLRWARRKIVRTQRAERAQVRSAWKQERATRTRERAARTKSGWRGVLQLLTGQLPFIRLQNAHESYDEYQRYRRQIERMFEEQMQERRDAQRRIDEVRLRQRAERAALIERVALLLQLERDPPTRGRKRDRNSFTLEM